MNNTSNMSNPSNTINDPFNSNSLKDLQDKLDLLNEIFDIVRLVDPIHKEIINIDVKMGGMAMSTRTCSCFSSWDSGTVCTNCIAMRAHLSRQEETKIEVSDGKIHIIWARPFRLHERELVLELGKDITGTLLAKDLEAQTIDNIIRHIEMMNRLPVEDPLTHLYSRSFIEERLPYEFSQLFVTCGSGMLILLNIDRLGAINTAYGYEAGDAAIKAVAMTLQGQLHPQHDWAARYDDETFLIFIRNPNERAKESFLTHLIDRISSTPILFGPDVLEITASVGAVYFECCDMAKPMDTETPVYEAYRNLLQAKGNGRNQYCCTIST